jgi:hypothetical protein
VVRLGWLTCGRRRTGGRRWDLQRPVAGRQFTAGLEAGSRSQRHQALYVALLTTSGRDAAVASGRRRCMSPRTRFVPFVLVFH